MRATPVATVAATGRAHSEGVLGHLSDSVILAIVAENDDIPWGTGEGDGGKEGEGGVDEEVTEGKGTNAELLTGRHAASSDPYGDNTPALSRTTIHFEYQKTTTTRYLVRLTRIVVAFLR